MNSADWPLVIDGSEDRTDDDLLRAVITFYRAFNTRDLNLMESVWVHSQDALLCNPLGGFVRGWPEIRELYAFIFEGPARVRVEFYDFRVMREERLACVAGRERGGAVVAGETIPLAIRTSRVFMRHSGVWRQIHHHGSIDDPDLLRRYQTAIFRAAES